MLSKFSLYQSLLFVQLGWQCNLLYIIYEKVFYAIVSAWHWLHMFIYSNQFYKSVSILFFLLFGLAMQLFFCTHTSAIWKCWQFTFFFSNLFMSDLCLGYNTRLGKQKTITFLYLTLFRLIHSAIQGIFGENLMYLIILRINVSVFI